MATLSLSGGTGDYALIFSAVKQSMGFRTMAQLADMGAVIAESLKERRETVAISESSTGGLISAALLAVAGASHYYKGGGVVYTPRAMHRILEIDLKTLTGIRSSSEPYAELAAQAIRERFNATWGLSETGATGPEGNRYGDPAGHSCIAVAGPVVRVMTLRTGSADREANMWTFTRTALDFFADTLAAQE